MAVKHAVSADPLEVVGELLDIGSFDTVYRDVYLQRARTLMAGVLPIDEFHRLVREQGELARLPVTIGLAVEKSDWAQVKELSSRGDALRRAAEGKRHQIETAGRIYADADLPLDPFSPGLLPFTRLPTKEPSALRAQAAEHLAALERGDAAWKDFYSARRVALQAVTVTTAEASPTPSSAPAPPSMDPREAAERALKAGDMKGLARLADSLLSAVRPAKREPTSPGAAPRAMGTSRAAPTDLLTNFSAETLEGARRLGLAPRRLEPRTEFASLRQYAWSPHFDYGPGRINVEQVPLPAGTPEGFRQRLEMLIVHPLVNSGGARHLPTFVAEDVLIEDFPDPTEGQAPAPSPLLGTLHLSGRRGLARTTIEQALLAHGADVVERELKLDPRVFRVVCIPPDVHLRLGEAEGWGRQTFWTHFDGYLVMADGRLRALAGGEVRYGGLFDLVGVSRDYDSDRMMARLAVVRRERMVAW